MIKPYYERSIEDFPDSAIVQVRQSTERGSDLWYAVMNRPPGLLGQSMPDFSTCGRIEEEAVRLCATKLREDAKGTGKYAPHSCFSGYDLHWVLNPWWAHCNGEEVAEDMLASLKRK